MFLKVIFFTLEDILDKNGSKWGAFLWQIFCQNHFGHPIRLKIHIRGCKLVKYQCNLFFIFLSVRPYWICVSDKKCGPLENILNALCSSLTFIRFSIVKQYCRFFLKVQLADTDLIKINCLVYNRHNICTEHIFEIRPFMYDVRQNIFEKTS